MPPPSTSYAPSSYQRLLTGGHSTQEPGGIHQSSMQICPSPLFIRVGGSQADNAIYNMTRSTSTTSVEGANRFAKACGKNPQLFLTMERWKEVLKFAQDAGAKIVSTLA